MQRRSRTARAAMLAAVVVLGEWAGTARAIIPAFPFPPVNKPPTGVSPEPPIVITPPPVIVPPIERPPPVHRTPEPATLVLGLIGAGVAGLAARRTQTRGRAATK
jgi:hypothetical protein